MPRNRTTEDIEMDLEFQFQFGKYKYSTVLEVLKKDPHYLEWFVTNVNGYSLADDVEEAVSDDLFRLELLADY